MITPLFIDQCFQFEHSPAGEVSRAFIGAMDSNEWNPLVYASDRQPRIINTPDYVKLLHQKSFYKYLAAATRRVLPDITWLPGQEWPAWGKKAVNVILKDIRDNLVKPDYIHSICFHVANHWAALKIKRATGLPWVMQYYDPWADNPYRPFKTKFFKNIDWKMERIAVEQADLIIHDNEIIADLWRKRYGEKIGEKIFVLPLTVPMPKVQVDSIQHSDSEILVISHIGKFYANRNASPFIKSVSRLLKEHPEFRSRIKVNFVGWVIDEDKDLIFKEGLGDVFVLHGMLPAADCESFYLQSDMFLAVDGVNPDNIFFPSKILKYFYFQRPILGITPKGSVLDSELRQANHAVFENSDIDGISAFLFKALTRYESICSFNKAYWEKFKPVNVVNQYETLVKNKLGITLN